MALDFQIKCLFGMSCVKLVHTINTNKVLSDIITEKISFYMGYRKKLYVYTKFQN